MCSTTYTELTRKRVFCKKPHRCAWCGEPIAVGEAAQFRSYIFEAGPQSDWQHPECFDAMEDSDHEYICDGWEEGVFNRGQKAEDFDG